MDRGAWWAMVHGVAKSQTDWATKQQQKHAYKRIKLWDLGMSNVWLRLPTKYRVTLWVLNLDRDMICVLPFQVTGHLLRHPSIFKSNLSHPPPPTNMLSDSLSGHGRPTYSVALTGTLPMLEISPLHPYTTHHADFFSSSWFHGLLLTLTSTWSEQMSPSSYSRGSPPTCPLGATLSNPHHFPKSSQWSSRDRNGAYSFTVASTSPIISSSIFITKTLILNLPNKTLLCVFLLANACPPFSQPLHDNDIASFSSSNTVPHSEPLQILFRLPPSLHHSPPAFHGIQMDFPQESLPWDILNCLIQE